MNRYITLFALLIAFSFASDAYAQTYGIGGSDAPAPVEDLDLSESDFGCRWEDEDMQNEPGGGITQVEECCIDGQCAVTDCRDYPDYGDPACPSDLPGSDDDGSGGSGGGGGEGSLWGGTVWSFRATSITGIVEVGEF